MPFVAAAGSAIIAGLTGLGLIGGGASLFEQQRKLKSQAAAALNQSISEAEAAGARARGDPGFAPAPGVTPALPDIVQPTPLPGPGEVSVQLGTGQERARRRRAKAGRQSRVFGGAGLLIPEADIRRQTLGGF